MTDRRSPPDSAHSEEGRAFLQSRVALFWKVMFFINLLSLVAGAAGAIVEPRVDFLIVAILGVQSGAIWWLCRRGERSIRFSRLMEAGGLLVNLTGGAVMGRYLLGGFARDHALMTAEGALMADAYVTMLLLGGTSVLVVIRAALVPSSPRRTVVVSAIVGAPMILAAALLVPGPDAGLAWRPLDSDALPWIPATAALMWLVTVISCAIISSVFYGLRAQVREAQQLGQYVLEGKIGEGGMGEVYRARHGMMRRPSALKLMRVDRTDELNLRRFEREVQQTARLTHPNTITIFDYGRTHDGVFYYAMELLDGANLQRVVAVSGPQAAGRVVRILTMACGALTEAHAIGLIHRDIKPANIMLCTQGGERDVVKLLDFGLVKDVVVGGEVQLTAADVRTGTPQYMAPESIIEPDLVDARTDIYALGAVAYYLLAGAEVFTGKSVLEVCGQHLHQAPQPLAARGIAAPADLEGVVLACLAKDPDRRPQSAAELRRLLEACAVEPWTSADALDWWGEHQAALDGVPVEAPRAPRALAVA